MLFFKFFFRTHVIVLQIDLKLFQKKVLKGHSIFWDILLDKNFKRLYSLFTPPLESIRPPINFQLVSELSFTYKDWYLVMDPIGEGLFAQGRLSSRPPLFCEINFSHWKTLMKIFVIDQDIELWNIITTWPKVPIKKDAQANDVLKTKSEYSQIFTKWFGIRF